MYREYTHLKYKICTIKIFLKSGNGHSERRLPCSVTRNSSLLSVNLGGKSANTTVYSFYVYRNSKHFLKELKRKKECHLTQFLCPNLK